MSRVFLSYIYTRKTIEKPLPSRELPSDRRPGRHPRRCPRGSCPALPLGEPHPLPSGGRYGRGYPPANHNEKLWIRGNRGYPMVPLETGSTSAKSSTDVRRDESTCMVLVRSSGIRGKLGYGNGRSVTDNSKRNARYRP